MYKRWLCCIVFFACIFNNHLICLSSDNKIQIVYHMATLNNWLDIAKEQIQALVISGLGDACDNITVTVVGPEIQEAHQLFENLTFSDKIQIIHAGENIHLYEFPGIEKVLEIAREQTKTRILYIHSKGVTYAGSPSERNIHQWRRFMEYFCINKWKDCLEQLEVADTCGVDWVTDCNTQDSYYAGNFWWARAEHVLKCTLNYNSRWDCESFIGTGNPVAACLCSSGYNPKLRDFFSDEVILSLQLFPDGKPIKGVIGWGSFYYDDIYYRSD